MIKKIQVLTDYGKRVANLAHFYPEIIQWVTAFASCAIEGNQSAKYMMDLWNSGKREQFILELYRGWSSYEDITYGKRDRGCVKARL